jgi:hypothetical protein
MTKEQQMQLARDIAKEVIKNQPKLECPHGIDADTARCLLEFGKMWAGGKKTAVGAIIILIIGGIGTALWAGVRAMIKG